jgi:hypothetical protein
MIELAIAAYAIQASDACRTLEGDALTLVALEENRICDRRAQHPAAKKSLPNVWQQWLKLLNGELHELLVAARPVRVSNLSADIDSDDRLSGRR